MIKDARPRATQIGHVSQISVMLLIEPLAQILRHLLVLV
jgi:hypothetical protein